LFRFAVAYLPLFAWLVRLRMNLRMMRYGKKMATDGHPENDVMTKKAVEFMESQIRDPQLREKVRPNSKCEFQNLDTHTHKHTQNYTHISATES
jgi:hypothetical protein